jgi:cytochrome c2
MFITRAEQDRLMLELARRGEWTDSWFRGSGPVWGGDRLLDWVHAPAHEVPSTQVASVGGY